MVKSLIVEDSELARRELTELLAAHDNIEVCGQAGDIERARLAIDKIKPELLFLDIHLPDGSGFDLLEQIDQVPQVIFTTAYDQYAVKAFEKNALDYLLKPIKPEALDRALSRLNQSNGVEGQTSGEGRLDMNSRIFVKDGDHCWLVALNSIRWAASLGNYVELHFDDHKALINKPMSKIEQRLPEQVFFRASRQYIVNMNFVKNIAPWSNGGFLLQLEGEIEIEVSRRYASKLRQMLSL